MNELDNLTSAEQQLMAKLPMPGVDSGIDEKERLENEAAMLEESRRIYCGYVELTQEGDLEALKRALFYAWYQLSEPWWLTGISELPDHKTRTLVVSLESALAQGLTDEELDYMLPYYMVVCSYYLERFYPLPYIQRASDKASDNARDIAKNSKCDWSVRGQMGEYWG